MAVCYVIGFAVLKYTKFGRSAYSIGGNIEAARLSGVPVVKNKILIYIICGLTAGIAGIILSSRMFSGQPSAGNGLELDAIAAVVIGGTPMSGGKAHVLGTVVGALIMQMITLTCVMNNIPDQYAQVFKAAIIVFAVFIQREQAK